MSENFRLIVDIVSRRNYNTAKKTGDIETNDAYTKKAKGTSAWQALQNIEYDDGNKVFTQQEIAKINRFVGKPQDNGELDLTDAIKKAGFGDRLETLVSQDQGLQNNPFETQIAPQNVEPTNPFMANNEIPTQSENSGFESQLKYSDNKLNNLFVAAYTVIEDDTKLTIKVDGKQVIATKSEILNMLAADGNISADEQKAFIISARDAAKKSFTEDGKNQVLGKGAKNSEEFIDAFKHMPAEDFYFGRGKQARFAKNYLENNQRNAQLSARRILTKLDDRELNKIASRAGNTDISITIAPQGPVELSADEVAPYTTILTTKVDALPVSVDFTNAKCVKNGNNVTLTVPNSNFVAEFTLNNNNIASVKITVDTNEPDNYSEYFYGNDGHVSKKTYSETDIDAGRRDVTTEDFDKAVKAFETYQDGKLLYFAEYPLLDKEAVANIAKYYTYLADGTKVEEIFTDNLVINKFDASGKLITTETFEWAEEDNTYNKTIGGQDVVIISDLADKSVDVYLAKIPEVIYAKVPLTTSGTLKLVIHEGTEIFGLITPNVEDAKWSIELTKDGNFCVNVFSVGDDKKSYMYVFDTNGTLISKDAEAPDLETILTVPKQEAASVVVAEQPEQPKVEEPVVPAETPVVESASTETVTAQPEEVKPVDYASQLQYNNNELNNLFISSFKMIADDKELTINLNGEKVTGNKNKLLELIAKDGSITNEEQKAFILAARAAAKASYNEDGKHRNLKKGEKNTKEDVEVFTKLPLKQFYNLNASFIRTVEDNKRNALVTARRSLTELSDKELNKIADKAGDASITIQIEPKTSSAKEPAQVTQPASKVTVTTLDELVEVYDKEVSAKYPVKNDMPDPRKDYAAFRMYFRQFKYDSDVHIPKNAEDITQESDGTYIIKSADKKVIIKPNATLSVYWGETLLCKCYPPENISSSSKQKYNFDLYDDAETWAAANPDKVEFVKEDAKNPEPEKPVEQQPVTATQTPVVAAVEPVAINTENPAEATPAQGETPSGQQPQEELKIPDSVDLSSLIVPGSGANNSIDIPLSKPDPVDYSANLVPPPIDAAANVSVPTGEPPVAEAISADLAETETVQPKPRTEVVENEKGKNVITFDETKGTVVIERYANKVLVSKSTANISEYDEETKEVRDALEHIHYLYLDDGSRIEGIRTPKEETVKVIDKNGNTILTDTFAINPGYSSVDFKISFAGKDLKIASTFDEESSKKILEKTPQELLNLLGDNFEIMLGGMPGYGFGGNRTHILAVNPHTNTYEITIFNEDSEFVYTYENGKITKKEPQDAPDLVLDNTPAQPEVPEQIEMSQVLPPPTEQATQNPKNPAAPTEGTTATDATSAVSSEDSASADEIKPAVTATEATKTSTPDATKAKPKTDTVEDGDIKRVITFNDNNTVTIEWYNKGVLVNKELGLSSHYNKSTKLLNDRLSISNYGYLDDGTVIEIKTGGGKDLVTIRNKDGKIVSSDSLVCNPEKEEISFNISLGEKAFKVDSIYDEATTKKIIEMIPKNLLELLGDNLKISMISANPGLIIFDNDKKINITGFYANSYTIQCLNNDNSIKVVYTYEDGKITGKSPETAPDLILSPIDPGLFKVTRPLQFKQESDYPVLEDMPNPAENLEAFLAYFKDKNPEAYKELNNKISWKLYGGKTMQDVVTVKVEDGYYQFNIGGSDEYQVSFNGIGQTYSSVGSHKYYPDGTYACADTNGQITSVETSENRYYVSYDNSDEDSTKKGKVVTIKDKDNNTIQVLQYAEDNVNLLSQRDYDTTKPKKPVLTTYSKGQISEQVTVQEQGYGNPDIVLEKVVPLEDGSQVKTIYNLKGKKLEEITYKDGTEVKVTAQEKLQGIISMLEAGNFDEAQKQIEELLAQNWQTYTFGCNRNDDLTGSFLSDDSVDAAWRNINSGINTPNPELLQKGISTLRAIKDNGDIISREELTPEQIREHYAPAMQKACDDLLEAINQGNTDNILELDCVKTIIKLRSYPYNINFNFKVDTLPKIAVFWETIFGTTENNQMSINEAINQLVFLKKEYGISINPVMNKWEKNSCARRISEVQDEVVGLIASDSSSVDEIMKSDELRKLINAARFVCAINITIQDKDTVVAPLTIGDTTYDINWLKSTYEALSAAINDNKINDIKTQIQKLVTAKKHGFPVNLHGNGTYTVKYVPEWVLPEEALKRGQENFSTDTAPWLSIGSTTLDYYNQTLKYYRWDGRDIAESYIYGRTLGVSEAIFASGLNYYPKNSEEFAKGIELINSKEKLDTINQLLCSLGVEGGNPNPLAVWCQRSGNPDLLRHLGQYDPYFKALYEGTEERKPIPASASK